MLQTTKLQRICDADYKQFRFLYQENLTNIGTDKKKFDICLEAEVTVSLMRSVHQALICNLTTFQFNL